MRKLLMMIGLTVAMAGQTAAYAADLAAAVLPGSRSGVLNEPLTTFATVINVSGGDATDCTVATIAPGVTLDFNATNSMTNLPTGMTNTAVSIANGAAQSFLLTLTADTVLNAGEIPLIFGCAGLAPAPIISGIDTLLLSAGTSPPPDIIAISATQSRNGIVSTNGESGTGAFAVATANVGIGATITASANLGSASSLPVALALCQTNAASACLSPPAAAVAVNYPSGGTANFSIFATAGGAVPLDPAGNRIFVTFTDANRVVRGLTSVAVSSAPAPVTFSPAPSDPPGPSTTLYNAPFYSCTRNFFVATTGSDSNPGTQSQPFLTIQHADSASRQGGDCINVAAGTYKADVLIQHGGSGPTPAGYVVYRCATLDGCHILAPGNGHLWGFKQPANFVVVDGFELDGNAALQAHGIADACFDSDGDTFGTGNSSHHLWLLNNLIHDCNESGVQFNNKEWYYVIHNSVFKNSFTSGFQGSGVSFVVIQCIENADPACASGNTYAGGTGTYVPSGMDLSFAPPFHNIVAANLIFNNMIAASNSIGCGNHTDGNGLILDTFSDETTNTIVYPFATLVGGNVSFANGGRGIHVFRSSNITIANNTAYGNGTDTCLNAFFLGDLSQAGGSDNVWVNNIGQSVLSASTSNCQFCGGRNAPFEAGDGGGVTDNNNIYMRNVLFGGQGVQLFDQDVDTFSCLNNQCSANPKLMAPMSQNFALAPTSPALGYGLPGFYFESAPADAGACSQSLTACP